MPTPDADPRIPPVRLLHGAAALFALLGVTIAIWLVDKAIRYPSVRAVQGGASAPLWIPFTVFVAVGTAAAVYLFLKAARRAEHMGAGERESGGARGS